MGSGNPKPKYHNHSPLEPTPYRLGIGSLTSFFLSKRRHIFTTVVPLLTTSHHPGLGVLKCNTQINWALAFIKALPFGVHCHQVAVVTAKV